VCSIAGRRRAERGIDAVERRLADKGAQQLVMARARLVRAADERIDDAEPRRSAEPVRGDTGPGP